MKGISSSRVVLADLPNMLLGDDMTVEVAEAALEEHPDRVGQPIDRSEMPHGVEPGVLLRTVGRVEGGASVERVLRRHGLSLKAYGESLPV
jgi:hypothetical protein